MEYTSRGSAIYLGGKSMRGARQNFDRVYGKALKALGIDYKLVQEGRTHTINEEKFMKDDTSIVWATSGERLALYVSKKP